MYSWMKSLLLLAILLQSLANIHCLCPGRTFNRVDGMRYLEDILLGPTTLPVHVDDCKRACQLDVRCFAYQMNWTDENYGYCQTVAKTKSNIIPVESNNSCTVFAWCPAKMTFFPTIGNCYLYIADTTVIWLEGWEICNSLHPDCHLIDIQFEEEQNIAVNLKAPSTIIWLGGRRYGPSKYDVLWVHTNTSIQNQSYTNWYTGEPSNKPGEDCIRLADDTTWRDGMCSYRRHVLCEY